MAYLDLYKLMEESNRIEGIDRAPTEQEMDAAESFMALETITVGDVCAFVAICQPGAVLRNRPGLDVRVGSHIAPPGGPGITTRLENLLRFLSRHDPYRVHHSYEELHPFTDGNGRSGRIVWAWQMREFPLGFLHHWYYQSLGAGR